MSVADAATGRGQLAQSRRTSCSGGALGRELRAEHLDVDHRAQALRIARPPAGRARVSGRVTLGVRVVGLDDPLHELVTDDVLAAEAYELDVLDRVEHLADGDQARTAARAAGRPA